MDMTTPVLRSRLVPWDDAAFVREFEHARDTAIAEGLTINGPKAAQRVEQLLHAAGYPNAVVDCERTVEDALRHAAVWTVRRDGG